MMKPNIGGTSVSTVLVLFLILIPIVPRGLLIYRSLLVSQTEVVKGLTPMMLMLGRMGIYPQGPFSM